MGLVVTATLSSPENVSYNFAFIPSLWLKGLDLGQVCVFFLVQGVFLKKNGTHLEVKLVTKKKRVYCKAIHPLSILPIH